jgi:hypothetical protein
MAKLQVFLIWSGPASRKVALALHPWLHELIHEVRPFMSELDIEKGSDWLLRLTESLEMAAFGIVCLTPDNRQAAWPHYEAGILAHALKGRVAPFLLSMSANDYRTGPLHRYQVTAAGEKHEVKELVKTLNRLCEDPIEDNLLDKSFERLWPELDARLRAIIEEEQVVRPRAPEVRELLEDVLRSQREQAQALATQTKALSDVQRAVAVLARLVALSRSVGSRLIIPRAVRSGARGLASLVEDDWDADLDLLRDVLPFLRGPGGQRSSTTADPSAATDENAPAAQPAQPPSKEGSTAAEKDEKRSDTKGNA